MTRRPHVWTVVLGVGALIGLFFASMSTYDFVMHLDRQVHDVHCSFVPGAGPGGAESGCQVTMVSSYSSLFRTSVWGGVPISLPAMAVFAFLLAFAVELTLTDRQHRVRSAGFAALAGGVPALASLVMAYISIAKLGVVCKMCIGIYIASGLCFAGGLGLFIRAWRGRSSESSGRTEQHSVPVLLSKRKQPAADAEHPNAPAWVSASAGDEHDGERAPSPDVVIEPVPETRQTRRPRPVSWAYLAGAFGVGVLFVALPMISYVSAAPRHERFIGTCGSLAKVADPSLAIPLDDNAGQPEVTEVLDPLCPACSGFEQRLEATGLTSQMHRKALLFPLDSTCNWMVDSAIHPGACVVSSAMMCAGPRDRDVLSWSFRHQKDIMQATKADPDAAKRMVLAKFPSLESCMDSPVTKAKLARSLRWAVANRLPVMTPQLYVGKVKLCEEDVDLGLDYMLSRMLSAYRAGTLKASAPTEPTPPALAGDPEPTTAKQPRRKRVRSKPAPATKPPAPAKDESTTESTTKTAPVDESTKSTSPATTTPPATTDKPPQTKPPATAPPATTEPAKTTPPAHKPAATKPPASKPTPTKPPASSAPATNDKGVSP